MINEFTVEAVDLGDLEKLRIGHDNSGEKIKEIQFLKGEILIHLFFSIRGFTWLVFGLG